MKKLFISIILLSTTLAVSAQALRYSRIGTFRNDGEIEILQPKTTLVVDLTVEKVSVTAGPYARYAQKYLGVIAPLTDQTNYSIVGSDIYIKDENYIKPEAEFRSTKGLNKAVQLPIDKDNLFTKSSENAARDAASSIFTIRRQRRELVSGDAGEGFFGAGMQPALDRLDQMEREYFELFVGQNEVEIEKKQYLLHLDSLKKNYVVCRFDEKRGVVSNSDLSATPIALQIIPVDSVDTKSIEAGLKARTSHVVELRVAAPSECILYNNTSEIYTTNLPIYEFGKTIKVEVQ